MPSAILPSVATFIVPQGSTELAAVLGLIVAALPGAREPRWLAPDRAVDVPFNASADDLPALRQAVAAAAQSGGAAVDVVLQPSAGRRKRLLLADMDSTMIGQECIDELADFAGLKSLVAAVTDRAMRGEVAFEPALRERVALLRGLPLDVIDTVLRERITLTPGGVTLVRTMQAHRAYCALISGGFTLFTAPVAGMIGFDEHRGNTLLVEGERLDGKVAEPILGREAKLAALLELRARFGLADIDTLAIGDGANDLGMLQAAGLGIAYHARPAVAAVATGRIDHNDLSALLFVQGYRLEEFA
jgi:phosphoserine phosphatase